MWMAILSVVVFIILFIAMLTAYEVLEKEATIPSQFLAYVAPLAYVQRAFPNEKNSLHTMQYAFIILLLFPIVNFINLVNGFTFGDITDGILIFTLLTVAMLMMLNGRQTFVSVEEELKEMSELKEQLASLEADIASNNQIFEVEKETLETLCKQFLETLKAAYDEMKEIENVNAEIEGIIEYFNERIAIVRDNLQAIKAVDNQTEIAIDTNVLMMWDDYIVEALMNRSILISKTVQGELDRLKTSNDEDKAYLARRGIRRLFNANTYRFVVSKWDTQFLKINNLSKGVPDDEIIADYLTEKVSGKRIVIMSDDRNFLISAKVHFPVLNLTTPRYFSEE